MTMGLDLADLAPGLRSAALYRLPGRDDADTFERMLLDGPGTVFVPPGDWFMPRTPSWGAARNVEVFVLPGVVLRGGGQWPAPANGNWVRLETLGGGVVAFAARAQPPGSQLVPTSTFLALSFGDPRVTANSYDTAGYWSAAQPTRLTVPATGVYHFDAGLGFAASNQGTVRELDVRVNGAVVLGRFPSPPSTFPWLGNVSRDVLLNAGDYLELVAYQDANLATGTAHAINQAGAMNSVALNTGTSTPIGLATLAGADAPVLAVHYLGALPS